MRWLYVLLAITMGCISRQPPDSMYDLTGIRYLQYQQLPPLEADSMSVQISADGTVQLFADRAPVELLLHKLLEAAAVSYDIRTLNLTGTVSLRLQDKSLLEAVNAILNDLEACAHWSCRHGCPMLVISNTQPVHGTKHAPDTSTTTITQKIALQHLPVAGIHKLLASISQLSCAQSIESNALILHGTPRSISQARRICRQCDQPPPSLIIEARLYVLNPNSIETLVQSEPFVNTGKLGLQYSPEQVTNYSATWNSLGDPAVIAFASNAAQYGDNALLATIINKSVAHSVASISVINGSKLSLDVGKSGQLLSFVQRGGVPTAQMNTVKTGVSLQITPKLLQRDSVYMKIASEQSRLADELALAANKARVNVDTEVQVPLGSWIIIGGMDYDITETLGSLPLWVRNIPMLHWLMTSQEHYYGHSQAILLIRALKEPHELKPTFLEP